MIHNMKCFLTEYMQKDEFLVLTSSFIVLTICHVSVVMKCVLIDVYASSREEDFGSRYQNSLEFRRNNEINVSSLSPSRWKTSPELTDRFDNPRAESKRARNGESTSCQQCAVELCVAAIVGRCP